MHSKSYCIAGVVYIFACISGVRAGSDHRRLLADLFEDYNTDERPILLESVPIDVSLDLNVLNLVGVNIAHGYVEVNLWLTLEWLDFHLIWEPVEYGGIRSLSIPIHKIWKPDIHLYSSLSVNVNPTYRTYAVVRSNGSVKYITPGTFRSICPTDVTNYPFDEHNCTLLFGSWSWDVAKLNLRAGSDSGKTSGLTQHSQWKLSGVPMDTETIPFFPYIAVTAVLQLKRRGELIFAESGFHLFLGAVSVLITFLMPSNSKQRITLGVFIFLALSATGISTNNTLAGKFSILVSYFRTLSLLTFASIAANIFILYFYNRNPILHRMPDWLRTTFCERIAFFIFLHRPVRKASGKTPKISCGSTNTTDGAQEYEELRTNLQILAQKTVGKESFPTNDWQYFAIVLDRLSLLIYLVSVVVFFISFYSAFA